MSALSVGSNVHSLFGFRIDEIPHFDDKRGPIVTFAAQMRSAEGPAVLVSGTRTVFGLVFHRFLQDASRPTWFRWAISEPLTGLAVAKGRTRRHALDDLAAKVACCGGVTDFEKVLEDAIRRSGKAMTRRRRA